MVRDYFSRWRNDISGGEQRVVHGFVDSARFSRDFDIFREQIESRTSK